jgi:hypothetical protein
MTDPIQFKRRHAARRQLPLRVRIHVHASDENRPIGRSRCFELTERALAELIEAATRMEARS